VRWEVYFEKDLHICLFIGLSAASIPIALGCGKCVEFGGFMGEFGAVGGKKSIFLYKMQLNRSDDLGCPKVVNCADYA
jgi:hypothetical protein